jgi:2-keto-4-pentenoate hydratase/2-oxohepta-3-ene-1,7-dioic acid hydratase in catechol pathway
MQFALSTVRVGSEPTPVIEVSGTYYRLDAVVPDLLVRAPARGLMNLFDDWDGSERRLQEALRALDQVPRCVPQPQRDDFLTPLQFPAKLILGGANYYEHMHRDAKKPDFSKDNAIPVFFLKAPTTSLVGCGRTVRYPVQSRSLDWEIELAVIVGRRMRRVSEADALRGIGAYTVGIDLSARDWQMNSSHPWKFDLFTGKSFDDSCPLGPKLVPARFVDPDNLQLQLRVNGELKQDANSSDMIWSVGEQLSILSEHITLEPGDVLLTGTPAGVGMTEGTFLKVGDRLDATITGLGTLHVEIIPDTPTSRTPSAG